MGPHPELDDYSDLITRTLHNVPEVSKITRLGLLKEQIYLGYSQELLAGSQNRLSDILGARNITLPGGVLEVQGKNLAIDPSGEFKSEREIGDVIVGMSPAGRPAYLRDSVEITRGYETPRYLNYFRSPDAHGAWQRDRAVTLGIQMRPGEQIAPFGTAVDAVLASLNGRLPEDLIVSRVSDQPQQVSESIDLFMQSLLEAIGLVIVVALVGFWEWRSAALMAVSIPLTLAMTFGAMHLLGPDLQQVSLASLIIALGLLVDDPVVAGDAIRRELDEGTPRRIAAWLGPTKLATAILFATITNIVAYLPLLLASGESGRFLYSLPVVLTCSLVMSRLVLMSFIPMLGHDLLRRRGTAAVTREARRTRGFTGAYYRTAGWLVDHRWLTLGASVVRLATGAFAARGLQPQFFPIDLQYLSYVDVWLPEDATFTSTNQAATAAEQVIEEVATRYCREHPGPDGKPRRVLNSITTFVGGGGPRFWLSAAPELFQTNYAQLVIRLEEKHDTAKVAPLLQDALSRTVPGARIDVRQLETSKPIGAPVAVRISGTEIPTLRALAEEMKGILRAAVKPFIVFSAIPYGIVGSLVTLAAVGLPFGFVAFLGVVSLIGVIVSHVIVLFDFHRGGPGAPRAAPRGATRSTATG